MSLDERKRLKKEISKMTPKSAVELLGERALEEHVEDDDDDLNTVCRRKHLNIAD